VPNFDTLTFVYDGTQDGGYRFAVKAGGLPQKLCNSDEILTLILTLSNGNPLGTNAIDGTVSVFIDEWLWQTPRVNLEPGETGKELLIVTAQTKQRLVDLLNPTKCPGPHTLRFELESGANLDNRKDDDVIDKIDLPLVLRPARVENVRASITRERTVSLTGDPNPEQSNQLVPIEYVVFQSGLEVGTSREARFVDSLADGGRNYRLRQPLPARSPNAVAPPSTPLPSRRTATASDSPGGGVVDPDDASAEYVVVARVVRDPTLMGLPSEPVTVKIDGAR
jgi:hypothetical protein